MDLKSQYDKQKEYYEYVQKQKENYTDLTSMEPPMKSETESGGSDCNDSIKKFAEILFSKNEKDLGNDISALILEEDMEGVDLFCMLIELVLYGLDILTEGSATIFNIKDEFDEMIDVIRKYLKKNIGIDMELKEEFVEPDEINLYRDKDNYYCQITQKPPPFLCYPGWYIMDYRFLTNQKFIFNSGTALNNFEAFFISKRRIFTIKFKFLS